MNLKEHNLFNGLLSMLWRCLNYKFKMWLLILLWMLNKIYKSKWWVEMHVMLIEIRLGINNLTNLIWTNTIRNTAKEIYLETKWYLSMSY